MIPMAPDKKIITMVIKVDLECERCKKKITRVLEKIKDKLSIDDFKLEEERNLVIIYGPFDPEKVRRKLCCEAGRIIKDMSVIVPDEKEKAEVMNDGGGKEDEEDGKSMAAAPAVNADLLLPLLRKMLVPPKGRTQTAPCTCCCCGCGCSCRKQTTTQPPAAKGVVATACVWPTPASSVSGHGYGYEAPSPCYGVPVYSVEEWY